MIRQDVWRVATLNIWNRQGPWEQRFPLIRDRLRALDLDAIGLQEVLAFPGLPNQAEALVEELGWNVHHGVAWDIGGGLVMGNAIASPHPLRDTQTFALPVPAGLEGRSVTFARVEAPHGPMPVFCTHLSWQLHLSEVRCAQVRALTDKVAALAPIDGPPPVLLGDFNAAPDADEMRFLRGLTPLGGPSVYFADCWDATNEGKGYTYDRRNSYAVRAHEPSRRIDYVFVRGPDRSLRGEPLDARVVFDEAIDGVWPSDHFGVVAEIYAAARHHDPF